MYCTLRDLYFESDDALISFRNIQAFLGAYVDGRTIKKLGMCKFKKFTERGEVDGNFQTIE